MGYKKLEPEMKARQWKKGQSGNPLGGKRHNLLKVEIQKLSLEKFQEIIEKCLGASPAELRALLKDPGTTALQVAVIRCFIKASDLGDYSIVERMTERLVGKIPDEIHVKSQNLNANLNANAEVSQEKVNEKVQAAIDSLKEEF